jgi:hypothetical protein
MNAMVHSFPVLIFCKPQLYDRYGSSINIELGDKESPRLSTYIRVLGSSSLTLTSRQHTPPETNHKVHLRPLLCWRLQVNRRQVVAPNLVILEKRNQSTILLLADLSFQMAAFFYTATTQTEKLRLNNMTTNLPAKTAMAMVVPAAVAAEMVVVGSRRRVWMWKGLQSLRRNDATNTLAIMKLLAMRWQKCGGGGSGGGGGGGSGGGTTLAAWRWWQRWRQQRGGGGSMAAMVAARRRQHGGGGGMLSFERSEIN